MYKKIHVFRIKPDTKLVDEIMRYCESHDIRSGVVISLIGSLKSVNLGILKELPGKFISKRMEGPLEIACGSGTVAEKDGKIILHIHIVVSDENGAVGGHLASATIFSTAEVVIGELPFQLERYKDDYTGLNELVEK
ncbi:MAG: DNA-binding protein [Candidatus Aenigmarchaeota archaeon]|nr:DNA-binding protein [Candidatus Aenigmarchaeota archaeon]